MKSNLNLIKNVNKNYSYAKIADITEYQWYKNSTNNYQDVTE